MVVDLLISETGVVGLYEGSGRRSLGRGLVAFQLNFGGVANVRVGIADGGLAWGKALTRR